MLTKERISKKGAIELSIGTVVIVVLAMSMLILGIVLIRQIFISTSENVGVLDDRMKKEISNLFEDNTGRTLVIYPSQIKFKQGESRFGFAISIRNIQQTGSTRRNYFYRIINESYDISYRDCFPPASTTGGSPPAPLDNWAKIPAGMLGGPYTLGAGEKLENPIQILFRISRTEPLCTFRLKVEVYENALPDPSTGQLPAGSSLVSTDYVYITIEPK